MKWFDNATQYEIYESTWEKGNVGRTILMFV